MSGAVKPDQPKAYLMNKDQPESGPWSEHLKPQAESQKIIETLIGKLENGSLTQQEQCRLSELLKKAPSSVVMTATRHQTFIGPVPPPEQLNQYDEETREIILDMARNEQHHAHELRERGLNGAIAKDKRGQWLGAAIAITGLLKADFCKAKPCEGTSSASPLMPSYICSVYRISSQAQPPQLER